MCSSDLILRAAELTRDQDCPILGVNLGHVGFLAEVERPTIEQIVNAIEQKTYKVEDRMTLNFKVERAGQTVAQGWALNEVSVERNNQNMVELFVQIDHRPLSRWGCDAVICATPTGSTAYAYSAGGPEIGRAHV